MPIYEYQGQQYEMSTTDPQEAKNKILSYLGQPPKEERSPKIGRKTGILEDIGIGLENVAHKGKTALDLLAGAAATYAGSQEEADKIYADMEARQKAREAELAKLDQGTGGKIISGVSGIVPAVAAAPFVGIPAALGGMTGMSALAGGGENVGKGAGVPESTAQAMLEAGIDYASLKIPVGRGVAQGAALGAGGNVAGTLATDVTGRALMEGTEAAKAYETTPEKLLVSGATGAIPGGVFGRFNRQGRLETQPQEAPIRETVPAQELQAKQIVENIKKQETERTAGMAEQPELPLEAPNKFGVKPEEMMVDENGMPIDVTKTLEAQKVERGTEAQPELFEPVPQEIPQIEIIGQPKIPPRQAAKAAYEADIPVQEKAAEILKTEGEQAATDFVDAYLNEERVAARQEQQQVVNAVANINPKLADAITPYRNISRDEALSAIKNAPDADSPTLGFTANQLKSRGRLGIEKIKNEGVRSSLAHLIGLRDEAGIRANTVLQGDNGIMRNLRKLETLLGEGRAGEVIRQIQEGQFNPEYKFNLDPEQMKVKDQIQQMFEQTRQEMERITGKPVKQIPNYFPSMFFGPFAVELRDANGRLVAFVTEKNAKEATRAADAVIADLAKEGETLTATQPKYRKELQSEAFRNRGGLAPYFESMMDLLGSDDPLVQRAQQSVQNQVAKRAMDTKKFSQRFERKAGVEGALGERTWKSAKENYRDAKDVLENYVRAFEDWKANQETAQFLNDVKENTGATNSYNILQNYFDDIRADSGAVDKFTNELATSLARATGRDISGAAKTGARKTADFMTKIWLGFYNPVAMGQNVLQPVHTLPKLVELASAGGSKDVITPFLTGMAQSLKDVSSLAGEKLLGKELTETARYMKEQEVIKPGLVESEGKTKIGHNIEKLGVSGGLLATEAFARATSFNIFREYLKASGLDEAQAREVAKNLTHEYMVNYESYAKPGILSQGGFAGELMGRLQSFKFNQFTQLANYVESAKRSKNPSAAITSLAVSIGMAGVSGMIGMDIAEGLYGALVSTGAVEPDTKSPRQMALDLGGAAAVGIPTAATGKWLSGSLSTNLLGDMSWRNIAPVVVGAFETLGKTPTLLKMAKEKITGEQLVPESEKAAALMAVTPATMRGVLEEKLLTDKEGRIVSPYTGETSYVKGPQDEGILSLTNIRSKERGETIARTVLQKAQEKRITEERKKVTDKLKKFVDESVRKGTELNPETVGKSLERIIELQGDPANTINSVLDFVKNNQLGDWFDRQLLSGNVTMTNVYKKLRALEQKQSIGK